MDRATVPPEEAGDAPVRDAAAQHAAAEPVGQSAPAVDLIFPFTSSLAASLRDELFTHRSLPT